MAKTKRLYVLLALCIAALLAAELLLFRSPLFSPWRLYDDEAALAGQLDRHQTADGRAFAENAAGVFEVDLRRFSGMRTAYVLEYEADTLLEIEWAFIISNGRCKLVVVDRAQEEILYTLAESSGGFTIRLPAGQYSIKLVGDRTHVEGSFTIKAM